MKILHLSDTPLSGAPARLAKLLHKHSGHESRHITWRRSVFGRVVPVDLVGQEMTNDALATWIGWADVIHYHNRWKRQDIFRATGINPPRVPSVIQIHSPRNEPECFDEEVNSKLPIAVIAQYHVRQWPELKFIVPNAVDITEIKPVSRPLTNVAIVSFAPSSCNGRGWNDKGYSEVARILKPWKLQGKIKFQLINGKPYEEMLTLKAKAHFGIDEIVTGSYHLSSLEYLALGVPCFANLDPQCEKVLKDLTGSTALPWLPANKHNLGTTLDYLIHLDDWKGTLWGTLQRAWMEKYWNPEIICKKYLDMYGAL